MKKSVLLTAKVQEKDELMEDIDLPYQGYMIRIKSPTAYKNTVGIYYIVDGKEDEGGEFDADMFIDHIMKFYHKYY